MVGRRKVISSPHRRPILPLTTLPSTFRLPRGSRKGGRASPAMRDAIARARPAASFRRHSLEREGDTASRIRSSPLETLIAPRGTDGSNPASSSGESRANLTSSIRAPKLRSTTACSLASLRRSVRHADFAGAKRSSNSLGRGFCARSPLKILSRPVHSSGAQSLPPPRGGPRVRIPSPESKSCRRWAI